MTDRFGEPVAAGFEHVFEGQRLFAGRSEFQKIDVYEHPHFGGLTLDDLIQTTDRDEFCYHEMLVHPALSSRPSMERVLIIGGGDGGTLRHVLMHGPVEAVMCEIDGEVVRVCRELMPGLSDGAFDDPRGTLVIGDGAAYVAGCSDEFDAILVDSTDPIGAATVLFSDDFYVACKQALKPDGVFVSQTGSPMYQGDEFTAALGRMAEVFGSVETYLGFVPTYPGVLWSYSAATDGPRLSSTTPAEVASRLADRGVETKYYTPDVHAAAFVLPSFVREIVLATSGAPEAQRSAR